MKKTNLKSLAFWLALLALGTSLGWWQNTRETDAPSQDKETRIISTIIDGDTLLLEPNEKVRLIGIDTPERDEAGYQEAKEALAALAAPGEFVVVWSDKDPYDQYGRTLLYIENNEGVFVNQRLLEEGWAKPLFFEPNTTFRDTFKDIHEKAKEEGLGLFSIE
jgi:micrococcal nuclease